VKKIIAALLCITFVFSIGAAAVSAATFADTNMEKVWTRTDQPVAAQKAVRTWMWGPESFATTQEAYAESPGGQRTVSYFDKSRMEVTNPNGDRNSQWFVTNGLLAKELITGKMQVGDNAFEDKWSAEIPVAGDPDDTNGATYATLGKVLAPVAERKAAVMETIDRAGKVGQNGALGNYTDYVSFVPETGHNIPRVFWDFLNSTGAVSDNGQTKQGKLFDPTFFATGFPITEAYWARVKVGGQEKDVLMQAYERRVLTFTPTNSAGWQVEMGNVGRHYYDWRYNGAGKPAVVTPPPPADPFADVPNPVNADISAKGGPAGTTFYMNIRGFTPNEQVGFWITAPTGETIGTIQTLSIGPTGAVDGFFVQTDPTWPVGLYTMVFQGVSSHHQSILHWKITP
jgi:hypothetical protein